MSEKLARQTGITDLHPAIRKPVSNILKHLHAEGLQFEVFESWRSPHLQQHYYAKGRNSRGRIINRSKVITYARPWQSFHQYGLAVDLVLKEGTRWSWDDRGDNARKWQRMHEVAREHGLKPLSFEKPHIQLASVPSSSDLHDGKYPDDGDLAWQKKLTQQIADWNGSPPAPPFPDTETARPPLGPAPGNSDAAWPRILEEILTLEGGYVDHPHDPGGPTNMGITLKTLADWRGSDVTAEDVKSLSRKEAEDIYRTNYYETVRADEMPPALAVQLFNIAVLSGSVRAARILQKSLNAKGASLVLDAIIGKRTMAAVSAVETGELIEVIHDTYLVYLKGLKHWPLFGRGWSNRLTRIHALSLEFLSEETGPTPALDTAPQNLHIWVISGLFGKFFSTGLKKISSALEAEGHTVHQAKWYERRLIEETIIRGFKANDISQMALVGHSLGANTALRLAKTLSAKGIPTDYLATLDPTIPVAALAKSSHNFRSADRRARAIAGAAEFSHPELDHVAIAGASEVHRKILAAVERIHKPQPTHEETDVIEHEETRAGGNRIEMSANDLREELLALIDILSEAGNPRGERHNPMTPVNALFGEGAVSRFLDGKKTGIGIMGLVAINILPVLFPQSAPMLALLNELGLEEIASDPEAGTKLLTAVFSAVAAWGGIGKLDKWVHQLAEKQVIKS